MTVIEYADFDCEYCAQFDTTMHQLLSAEGSSGDVAWVYRNYPITQLHPDAEQAAEAAECVAKASGNDVYWKFADSLFANQPVPPDQFFSYAQKAGTDVTAVELDPGYARAWALMSLAQFDVRRQAFFRCDPVG